MMSSVPAVVKPAMPAGNPQAPKVMSGAAPSAPQLVGGPLVSVAGAPKVLGSPGKPAAVPNANHTSAAALPLSLVQEHKVNAAAAPVQVPPPARTPEKKEAPVPRPTANGVEGPQSRPAVAPEAKKLEDGAAPVAVVNHAPDTTPQSTLAPTPAPSVAPPVSVAPLQPSAPPAAAAAGAPQSSPKLGHVSPPPAAPGSQPSSAAAAPAPPLPGEAKPPVAPPAPLDHQTLPKPVLEVKRALEPLPKPEFKVATPPRNNKRKREVKPVAEAKTPPSQSDERKSKRVRTRTQPYQSPLPELLFISKLKTPMKSPDDKLIVFYKNEFLAVRNAEGSFYICQAMQNIYKTSPKIRIRWLSQEKKDNKLTEVYVPDFYDATDFDCILTNLDLKRLDRNRYQLPEQERERTQSILKRALDVEKGVSEKPSVTEEHPDGLDLSLFRDESQLKTRRNSKQATKRKKAKGKENSELQAEGSGSERKSPRKGGRVKLREQEKKAAEGGGRDRAAAAKRRSEVAAALAKQAAVKQTVARGALPKPPPPKKARASPPQPAPPASSVAATSPAKSPRKAEPAPDPPSSPSRASKTRTGGKAVSTPPKTLAATRTKEREQHRGATSPAAAKGRKKPGKKA